jgi:predicted DsbA family dithiol-disulfide isomerase
MGYKLKQQFMKVEIWSDVMCPFCYIGKRRFETALAQFGHKDSVEVEWRSFQLDPTMQTQPGKNINQYLAERKGWTVEYAKQMNSHVTKMAAAEGLDYDFDRAVVANSFDAHRFASVAKQNGLGSQAEERLFSAYFTEGKNIADNETLAQLGEDIGLDAGLVKKVLAGDTGRASVINDIQEAESIGVRGVPFFVFNRQYAVSGAQPAEVFFNTLERSYSEWQKQQPVVLDADEANGEVCIPGGDCQ